MAVNAVLATDKTTPVLKLVRDEQDINLEFGEILLAYFDADGTLILVEQWDAEVATLRAAGFNLVGDDHDGYHLKVD